MPRTSRNSARNEVQTSSHVAAPSAATASNDGVEVEGADHTKMNAFEYLDFIISQSSDPKINQMLKILKTKLPDEVTKLVQEDKKGRSLVISGLPESPASVKPSERQKQLEDQVENILDILKVECRPVEVYRMGRLENSRPRLVKLLLPSKAHWATALSNACLLRSSELSEVFIRKSMTPDERKKEYELRQEARRRNAEVKRKGWVIYRGILTNVKDLRTQPNTGNLNPVMVQSQD